MLEGLNAEERRGFWGAIVVCIAIFFADASHSLPIPIFPSFAQSLGASLTMIGIYGSAVGVAMVLLSIPIGGLSDRIGRKGILLMGFVLFFVVPFIYAISTAPLHLLVARLLLGVAMGSTFGLGFIWASESTPEKLRSLVQGLYMTSMGLGFTTGPIIGGYASSIWGYNAAFLASSLLGAAGFTCLLFIKDQKTQVKRRTEETSLRIALKDPKVLAAGITNFINTLMYGALSTFFPLYGTLVGLTSSEVGVGFTVRGLASTAIRFPAGIASKGQAVLQLLVVGLAAQAIAIYLLSQTTQLNLLLILLAFQGVMYGISLTAGNVYVTREAHPEHRGAAMGVYQSFANASNVISPLILGGIAEIYGISTSLQLAAAASLIGVAFTTLMIRRKPKHEAT
jgi:predicted MFS family arabinose efflux permease